MTSLDRFGFLPMFNTVCLFLHQFCILWKAIPMMRRAPNRAAFARKLPLPTTRFTGGFSLLTVSLSNKKDANDQPRCSVNFKQICIFLLASSRENLPLSFANRHPNREERTDDSWRNSGQSRLFPQGGPGMHCAVADLSPPPWLSLIPSRQ